VLEKQLNQLFTLITDADTDARVRFDGLKGWDRRADEIVHEAADRLNIATADIVKVVLRLAKTPAAKRDELAHRVWAVAEGFESELALLPADDQHSFAESVVAVKKAGRCDVPVDSASLYAGSSLVGAPDLDQLILELQQAAHRLEALLRGHFFPPFADATGGNFADYRTKLAEDPEISARLLNITNERRRSTRTRQRGQ
jgi:hypothetical protein